MIVPTREEISREPVGRHAVVAVGYDDAKERIIVLNSWGRDWGDKGYFYMPYGSQDVFGFLEDHLCL